MIIMIVILEISIILFILEVKQPMPKTMEATWKVQLEQQDKKYVSTQKYKING